MNSGVPQRTASNLRPAVHANCGESLKRAHNVNSIFSLRALAAKKMPQEHDHRRCLAAEKPVIHAKRSTTNPVNSHISIAAVNIHTRLTSKDQKWPLFYRLAIRRKITSAMAENSRLNPSTESQEEPPPKTNFAKMVGIAVPHTIDAQNASARDMVL